MHSSRVPNYVILSLLSGIPFLCAWLGFTAMVAKDGRSSITEWFDPFLAGLTLLAILFVELVLVVVWPYLNAAKLKHVLAGILVIAQWAYIFGEILSNTITIGEPPEDIGTLFEIASGATLLLLSLALTIVYFIKQLQATSKNRVVMFTILILATVLIVGMMWWFTHPIDQSEPGAPAYIPGNPVYNFFR